MAAGEALAALTPRETEVLRPIAEGLSNPEIARRLVVTEVTAYESGLVVPARERG